MLSSAADGQDGFLLVSFSFCDQFAANLEARGDIQFVAEPLMQTIRATHVSQITFKSWTPLIRVAQGYLP